MFGEIPREVVDRFSAEAKGATFFGKPVADMDREELLAVIGYQGHQAESDRAEHARRLDFEMEQPDLTRQPSFWRAIFG